MYRVKINLLDGIASAKCEANIQPSISHIAIFLTDDRFYCLAFFSFEIVDVRRRHIDTIHSNKDALNQHLYMLK